MPPQASGLPIGCSIGKAPPDSQSDYPRMSRSSDTERSAPSFLTTHPVYYIYLVNASIHRYWKGKVSLTCGEYRLLKIRIFL